VVQQPNWGLEGLIFEDSVSHTSSRTPLNEWSARRRSRYLYNTHEHRTRTSMPSAGLELTVRNFDRLRPTP